MITRDIYTPVTDGWSSLDCVMQESTEKIDFLKYMTKQVFPEEEDYFLKQMGKELHCSQGFAMRIIRKRKIASTLTFLGGCFAATNI